MKKYLLGLFAVVLAVGFSAFTNSSSNSSEELFWYTFDPQTNTLTSSLGEIQREAAIDETCPDVQGEICAKAYSTDQSTLVNQLGQAPSGEQDFIEKPLQ